MTPLLDGYRICYTYPYCILSHKVKVKVLVFISTLCTQYLMNIYVSQAFFVLKCFGYNAFYFCLHSLFIIHWICYLYSEYIFIIGIEIVCRENGNERECTKLDFLLHEKYKNYLCSSSTGNGSFQWFMIPIKSPFHLLHHSQRIISDFLWNTVKYFIYRYFRSSSFQPLYWRSYPE